MARESTDLQALIQKMGNSALNFERARGATLYDFTDLGFLGTRDVNDYFVVLFAKTTGQLAATVQAADAGVIIPSHFNHGRSLQIYAIFTFCPGCRTSVRRLFHFGGGTGRVLQLSCVCDCEFLPVELPRNCGHGLGHVLFVKSCLQRKGRIIADCAV